MGNRVRIYLEELNSLHTALVTATHLRDLQGFKSRFS